MPKLSRVDPDILKLGLVSFLTDLSSEIIFSVFAVFFTTVAGASSALLGLLEGLADFSASSLDFVAGSLSDRAGKRKPFVIAGYAFSTAAKCILLVTTSVIGLGFFRVVERLGKSFRGPPRDAWLAAIAISEHRGYAFGVHKAMDKAGAVLGPLVAYGLLSRLGETQHGFRTLFLATLVPAVLSVLVLSFIPDRPLQLRGTEDRRWIFAAWKSLSPGFRRYLFTAGIFSLAYFSFGFLLLRALAEGFSVAETVLLYAWFNTTCVAAAPFAGKLGDRVGRIRIVGASYLIYATMSLGFVFAFAKWQIVALFAVYGVFYAIDEAQNKAFVADLEPGDRRATAIGVFNFATGVIYLPASLIAGALWNASYPRLVFTGAALLALAAAVILAILRPSRSVA